MSTQAPTGPAGPLTTVTVELGDRSYPVLVGPGARHRLADVMPAGARRAAVVTQAGIEVDVHPGVPAERLVVPDGEAAKTLHTVEQLCRAFARSGMSRRDVVVAVGGGVVTDVAGYAAASFHRGIAYVNVATTLLAQVDAAVGGKTGVNLPEGKNLVGAFWQPAAVLCDTDTLAALPPREWRSGRGEMAKYAFLPAGPDSTAGAGAGPAGAGGPGSSPADLLALSLPEQVARCVSTKAALVGVDEREGAVRIVLNYGHTLAHALEAAALHHPERGDLRHGEAVAIGLVFAAELARRLGRIDDAAVARHRQVVAAFDLAAELPPGSSAAELVGFMARDKKSHHDLTFVLDGPGGVEPVPGVSPADVVATLTAMGCGQ